METSKSVKISNTEVTEEAIDSNVKVLSHFKAVSDKQSPKYGE